MLPPRDPCYGLFPVPGKLFSPDIPTAGSLHSLRSLQYHLGNETFSDHSAECHNQPPGTPVILHPLFFFCFQQYI